MFYSKLFGGFYSSAVHGAGMPADAVTITAEEHAALLYGQSVGQRIVADTNGRPVLASPPPPTPEQVAATYAAAVQSHMDAAAIAAGYDNINTAVSYADEPVVSRFQTEGAAFRAWRSLCWDYCYTQLAAVQSATRTQPTIAELVAELPALVLP